MITWLASATIGTDAVAGRLQAAPFTGPSRRNLAPFDPSFQAKSPKGGSDDGASCPAPRTELDPADLVRHNPAHLSGCRIGRENPFRLDSPPLPAASDHGRH